MSGEIRSKAISNVVKKEVLREVQLETLSTIAEILTNSYGPDGSTTEIRTTIDHKDSGRTEYTKDGHKILGAIKFNKPIEYSIIDDLRNVTRNTVKTVGDGTTSAVLLSELLFKGICHYCNKNNKSEKYVLEILEKIAEEVFAHIRSHGREATIDDLYNIAYTATDGNEEIASNIKSIYEQFGKDVFIDVGISNTTNNIVKSYDGLTIEAGYFNTNFINNTKDSTAEIRNAKLYIFEDPIDTPEMFSLLGNIVTENIIIPTREAIAIAKQGGDISKATPMVPTVIFAPKYGADMRSNMDDILNWLGQFDASQKPPILMITNINKIEALYDLAKLSGAKLIKKYIDPEIQKMDIEKGLAASPSNIHTFAGSAEEIIADVKTTKIINPVNMLNPDGTKTDIYNNHLKSLKAELQKYEETRKDIKEMNLLRRRIQSLECNMVDYLIGGISYTDRDAKKDLVEDAVLNCRSAVEHGVGQAANFEALRACDELVTAKETKEDEAEELQVLEILANSYIHVYTKIYREQRNNGMDILQCLTEGVPYNIRTGEYDGKVLTSIEADIVILEAIIKIVGLMLKTNQYLLPDPSYNTYSY